MMIICMFFDNWNQEKDIVKVHNIKMRMLTEMPGGKWSLFQCIRMAPVSYY